MPTWIGKILCRMNFHRWEGLYVIRKCKGCGQYWLNVETTGNYPKR